jgi:hypothetical protein
MTKIKVDKPKPIKTLEMEVAISMMFGYRTHIIVPNLSWGFLSHEADLFLIKKTGWTIECEIKISKSDFLADFKKKHHHKERSNKVGEFYYAFPDYLYEKCRDLVPEDQGIIVCKRNQYNHVRAHIERPTKKIKNSRKLTEKEQLVVARLGCMRIWSLKTKVINLQNK